VCDTRTLSMGHIFNLRVVFVLFILIYIYRYLILLKIDSTSVWVFRYCLNNFKLLILHIMQMFKLKFSTIQSYRIVQKLFYSNKKKITIYIYYVL